MRIYLDLDGVLGDFHSAAAKLHGYDPEVVTQWDFYPQINVDMSAFWRKIHEEGQSFWERIEAYPWCKELYEECLRCAPTVILTSPSNHPSSPAGKASWMQRELGVLPCGYMIGGAKEFLAGPRHLLIDDSDANVEKFKEAGGRAILFPQRWNANRHITDPMRYVRHELLSMEECLK